jgi:phage terminase large subunit
VTPAQAKIKRWRENPPQAAHELFQVDLEPWQVDAIQASGGATPDPRRRLGMKACTGPGKTAVLAIIGWLRLLLYAEKGEHPKGAALSGEGRDNLRDNLWAEMAKWRNRSTVIQSAFAWTKEQIFAIDHPETWFLSARSYAKDADAETIGKALSGLHSRYPFMLLDEVGNMPVAVGQKASQIFTGGVIDGLIAAAGNPTSTTGLLYHIAVAARGQWVVITITADPDDPKRTSRVDIEHAREQILLYGRDNPWVKATILGEFPEVGFNQLLSITEVERAMGKHLRVDQFEFSQKRIGIDAARFGDDPWVIFPRQGLAAFKPVEMRNPRSHEVAARVALAKEKWHSEMEFFDGSGGFAAGAIDAMIQAGHNPQEVSFSGKAIDPRYFNKRSEMWFQMAEWVKRGGALPNLPILAKELTTPTYAFQNGKFRLEEKDQIKKRLGFSPNFADALCLTFAMPEAPASILPQVAGQSAHKSEYDPFAERLA